MAKCDYCGTIIFFGKRDPNGHFCNKGCQSQGELIAVSRQLPEAAVREQIGKVHQGLCPKCGGPGPTDVHLSHRVWSALLVTSWKSTPQLCCRSCGLKSQLADLAFSLSLGWWGFPFGFVVTPIQIGRNLFAMAFPPERLKPSDRLEKLVRLDIAADVVLKTRVKPPITYPSA
jgi:hypothetical protein